MDGTKPPASADALRSVRSGLARWRRCLASALAGTGYWLRKVLEKAEADNIFFMGGAIAFNILVAIIPLLLAAVGIAGTILKRQAHDPTDTVLRYILEALPPVSPEFEEMVRQVMAELLASSPALLSVGTIVLIWLATRLIGTLRTTLREIFDIQQDRGILAGKLFDVQIVIAAGTLLALNIGLTLALDVVTRLGLGVLGIQAEQFRGWQAGYATAIAFLSVWVMFLLIYRYLPPRRIGWRTAVIAATFTAVIFEIFKFAFSWYVTEIADYRSTYGSVATLFILFLWIYYTAVAFILGGEIAQVDAMRRVRRRQRERLT